MEGAGQKRHRKVQTKENVMKKLMLLMVPCFMVVSLCLVGTVNSGPNDTAVTQEQPSIVEKPAQDTQNAEITPINPRMPWTEKVRMQQEIKQRASARRSALIKDAAIKREQQSENMSNGSQPVVK